MISRALDYVANMICAGLRFRSYTIYDDFTRFYGYDDTEVDVTNVVIIDAYGSNNVDGLVRRIKDGL